ncbi:MAG TPA: CoA-binding protein, partial [Candidatus Krumholzibacteria bacterium]|nr:CoA-binding protein [Candidatus Krumholzibacteria bacterium]
MARIPEPVADFLNVRRIAVAGVSRSTKSAANPVFRKLRDSGYDVFPVNPNAPQVEGVTCYPNLASIPGGVDAVMVATHPDVSAGIVKQAAAQQIMRVWFHRSFGQGSVS